MPGREARQAEGREGGQERLLRRRGQWEVSVQPPWYLCPPALLLVRGEGWSSLCLTVWILSNGDSHAGPGVTLRIEQSNVSENLGTGWAGSPVFLDCLLQILTCNEVTLPSYRLFKIIIIIIVVVVESISCVRLFFTARGW